MQRAVSKAAGALPVQAFSGPDRVHQIARYPSKIARLVSKLQSASEPTSMTEGKSKWQPNSSLGKYLWLAAKTLTAMEDVVEEKLISRYLLSNPPLRIRRTLDQYMYYSIDYPSTAHRYKDQVVYRATQTGLEDERAGCSQGAQVLMVDQLWMWILDRSKYHVQYGYSSGSER
jgi:hypothetical protein